ncbi:MAG: DNA repair protein RecO [Desulfovibrio sp.]|jgi:DNA repair protein RecO (recombination protein O)|nr:DNA repair protein RecO [Desulfovibrio sp.]
MEFSERMLVLQVGKFREADLWVRLLSPSRGIIAAFAFGGSRSRKRFAGCLDTFNHIRVHVKASPGKQYFALQEGVLLEGVSRLRRDGGRFGMAVNCMRFLQSFGIVPEGAEKAHFLMRETLRVLEGCEDVPKLLPVFFRARLAFDQGYALELAHCSRCGKSLSGKPARLLIRAGRAVCPVCAGASSDYRLPLGSDTVSMLQSLHVLPPGDWAEPAVHPAAAGEFAEAVDAFIRYHVGITWEDGRFVRR